MKLMIFLLVTIIFTNTVFGQDEPIKGRYGGNDLRVRAGNGLIEESKLKKYDISKSGLKKIATIYWPDGKFGFQQIGITVFENSQKKEIMDSNLVNLNLKYLEKRLDSLELNDLTITDCPNNISELFKRKPIVSSIKILDMGGTFLKSIKDQGFDGLLIIYEDDFQDLITGSRVRFPSKGIFKYYKKELVYYGLYSSLIDLNTNKIVKNIGYKQLSADYCKLPFDEIRQNTEENRIILTSELHNRFINNINEIFRIHKIK